MCFFDLHPLALGKGGRKCQVRTIVKSPAPGIFPFPDGSYPALDALRQVTQGEVLQSVTCKHLQYLLYIVSGRLRPSMADYIDCRLHYLTLRNQTIRDMVKTLRLQPPIRWHCRGLMACPAVLRGVANVMRAMARHPLDAPLQHCGCQARALFEHWPLWLSGRSL